MGQEQCKQAIDLPNPLDYGGTCPGSHDLFVQGWQQPNCLFWIISCVQPNYRINEGFQMVIQSNGWKYWKLFIL